MFLFVWYDVLRDYGSGQIYGCGTSLEDVREKFLEDGDDCFEEAIDRAPDKVEPFSSKKAIGYQRGSA